MAEAFENAGYEQVEFDSAADVYVINTCTVTGLSSRKSRQAIRRARQLNGNAVVAAVGCYPQTARQEVEAMPEVDIVAGTADRQIISSFIYSETEDIMLLIYNNIKIIDKITNKVINQSNLCCCISDYTYIIYL
jgi:threonylcarbamoyladenosine tRNA methylthiotransferase MtaB